ncbi:MAG: HDOD domain-containing protein [Chitinispirillaceae bacterium]
MVTILLVSVNEREKQILKTALEQRAVKVIVCCPKYRHYMLVLKYLPDLVVMEFPHACSDQVHFTNLIRKNRKTEKIPVVGYGDPVDRMTKRGLCREGVGFYLDRPLKFSKLLQVVDQILKKKNKTLDSKPVLSDKEKDLELILNSMAPASEKVEAMTRHIAGLMAFPFTVARVLRLTQDEKTGAGDLAKAITADPAITAHLLRISNSVFFASSLRRIKSIKDAIVRIGFEETKKIVMSMSVINLFDKREKTTGFERTDFWSHSLAVGIIAERLARQMGTINTEDAFLGGLLHDLGVMILDEFLPSVFDRSLEVTVNAAGHFPDCQIEELGVNHIDLIDGLFPVWKLPQNITEGITNQFKILKSSSSQIDSDEKKLALCIGLANLIAKSLQYGRECDEFVFPVKNDLLTAAGMGAGVSRTFMDHTANSIEVFRRFLHLEKTDEGAKGGVLDQGLPSVAMINVPDDIMIPAYIYLSKENWNVKLISTELDPKTLDGSFDLILMWFGAQENGIDFEPYRRISKPSSKEYAPLFMLAAECAEKNLPREVSFMSSGCDLRHLVLSLSEVARGSIVRPQTNLDCTASPEKVDDTQQTPAAL